MSDTEMLEGTRARLYRTIRTAHLEQAALLTPATIIYRARRYDFDEGAAVGLHLVQAGPLRAAALLFRSDVNEFEINEPLMRYGVRGSALAVAALRLRETLGGERTSIVSYGIENFDPFSVPATGVKAMINASIDRRLSKWVWRRVDRFVYGTEAARSLYHRVLGPLGARSEEILIPTLPSRCHCEQIAPLENSFVFVGAFSERKGFPLLEDAWPRVLEQLPDARLQLLGKGPLEDDARLWAARDPSVSLTIDPSRPEIHHWLASSRVLALPSQPMPNWREQLGLPITEALAHGCRVVSTSETGLGSWLAENEHVVIRPTGAAQELADALVSATRCGPSTEEVLASLPARDGRLAADDWMFRAG